MKLPQKIAEETTEKLKATNLRLNKEEFRYIPVDLLPIVIESALHKYLFAILEASEEDPEMSSRDLLDKVMEEL